MPGPDPQDVLQDRLDGFNAEHAGVTAGLEKRFASPAGREILGSIAQFRGTLAGARRGLLSSAGADTFVALIGEYPSFGGGSGSGVGLPVFGEEGPGEGRFRRDAVDVITTGSIAIAAAGKVDPRYFDTLVDIAVGADDLAGLLRTVLLGDKPFPDDGGRIPQKWLDLMEELDRKTCGLAISHAVSHWGQAVDQARSRAWSTGITSINPAVGCAGQQVTVTGSGFGATQPAGVRFAFAGRGGGCVMASVVSWSDTQIVVVAPKDVGAGCIGFVQQGDPAELVSAADSVAGELERCIGLPAARAAQGFRTFGSRLIQACPPCLPGNVNYFQGGLPFIEFFSANGGPVAQIAPAAALTLSWSVRNASTVEIVEIPPPAGQADELPSVAGALNPASGSYAFPAVAGTFTWDREYELRARNTCTPANQPVTKRVTIRMRSRPDVSVGGIEATQATQFFNAAVHMPNASARKADNAIGLIANKPTIVRVFVDSGQSPTFDGGKVAGVRAELHGRTAAGAVLPGSPLAPLDPTFAPNAAHTIETQRRVPLTPQVIADERTLSAVPRSFLFRLPAGWIAAGAVDVEAEVLPPAAAQETGGTNNRLTQRLVFNNGGLPVHIALLPVSYTDTPTGAVVPPPSAAQSFAELDFIQRVYPSNRSLLNVVPAPGGSNPWFFSGDLTAGGPGCGMGWNLINIELAKRAFFNFGFEDRVFVALLNRPPSGNAGPASGCGMPMSSLGGTVVGAGVLAGIAVGSALAGPFGALIMAAAVARLGSAALGVASALVTGAGLPAGVGGILAQEVGHGFGLMHVPGSGAGAPFQAGWPDYLGIADPETVGFQSIGEFGLDVDDSIGFALRAYSPQMFTGGGGIGMTTDLMGYASSSDWISPFFYETMMAGKIVPPQGFGPSAARPLDDDSEEVEALEVALVSGVLREDGSELDPIFTHTRRFAFGDREPEAVRLELRAEDGTVLETRRVQRMDHEHEHEHEEGDEHDEEDALPLAFATAVAFHPRTAEIVIVRRDEVLVSEPVPARAPKLSAPRVASSEEGWLVEWEAEHERAEDVRYMVRYAVEDREGEPLWQVVAADLREPRVDLRAGDLAGGKARVQVGATVAGRTAWAQSEPFEVPHPPPVVAILAPLDGSRLRAGRPVLLRGEALALHGAEIDDERFTWASNRDGALGRGREVECTLSLGKHVVSLRVEAPHGPPASTTVQLTIAQRLRPERLDEPPRG
ncbi:MAG: IPT/TIG domain-containing protein [Gaiellaceae bacterium]